MPLPGDFVIMLNGVGRPRFICRTTEVTISRSSRSMRRLLGTRGTARETGGSIPIAAISLGKRRVKAFEIDDEILTVFERFEVVWPLDSADLITGPTSAST